MSLDFRTLLETSSLVTGTAPSSNEIVAEISKRSASGKVIQAMYGETYDRFGHTLDSIKYYFYVAAINWTLRRRGNAVEPTILVADIATCRNEPDDQHTELMHLGQKRANFVRAVDKTYQLGLNVLLMSDYLHSDDFQVHLRQVKKEAENRDDIRHWIEQTVPESKVEIESEKEFSYAFEEVATIIGYDVKVGPPREKFYDEPARLIGQALGYPPLQTIYLHPTFPIGVSRSFFFSNEEISKYGVTAYKAGSKSLSAHRVIIGKTTSDDLARLVGQSPVSKKATIPNAVIDLAVIGEMAKQWLNGELQPLNTRERFYSGDLSAAELQESAIANVENYVLRPLTAVMKGYDC